MSAHMSTQARGEIVAGDLVIHGVARYCWCGTRLSRYNDESVCFAHRSPKKRLVVEPEERHCAADPDCPIKPHKGRTMCAIHAEKAARRARRAGRPQCSEPGCTRRLGAGNRSGVCFHCGNSAKRQLARYHRRKVLVVRPVCSSPDCENKLGRNNRIGLCWLHGAKIRQRERRNKYRAAMGQEVRAYTRREA